MAQRGLGQFFGSPQPGRWAPAAAAPPERQEEQGNADDQEGSGNKEKAQRRLGSFFETKAGAWSPPDKAPVVAEEPAPALARSPPAAPIPLPSDVLDRMATVRSYQPRSAPLS